MLATTYRHVKHFHGRKMARRIIGATQFLPRYYRAFVTANATLHSLSCHIPARLGGHGHRDDPDRPDTDLPEPAFAGSADQALRHQGPCSGGIARTQRQLEGGAAAGACAVGGRNGGVV